MSERTQIFNESLNRSLVLPYTYDFSERNMCTRYPENYSRHYVSASPSVRAAANTNSERKRSELYEIYSNFVNPGLNAFDNTVTALGKTLSASIKKVEDMLFAKLSNLAEESRRLAKAKELMLLPEFNKIREQMLIGLIGQRDKLIRSSTLKYLTSLKITDPTVLAKVVQRPEFKYITEKMTAVTAKFGRLSQKLLNNPYYLNQFKWLESMINQFSEIGLKIAKGAKAGLLALVDVIFKVVDFVKAIFEDKENLGWQISDNKDSIFFKLVALILAIIIAIIGIILIIKGMIIAAICLAVAGVVFAVMEIINGIDPLVESVSKSILWLSKLSL